MRLLARFLLVFSVVLVLLFSSSKSTFAQTVTPTPPTSIPGSNPNVAPNLHNGIQVIMLETLSAIGCQLTGEDYLNPENQCLGLDNATKKIGFVSNGGGLIGTLVVASSYTFTPAASSRQYVAYLKHNFGPVKSTYAADGDGGVADCNNGIGFCQLLPLLPFWVAMRNFAYLILILVFVVMGLLIMLRVHVDPRTVMSVQNQIPKLIVSIVLITFSFAIAGFLIDVMYTASYLLGEVVSTTGAQQVPYTEIINSNNVFDAATKAYNGGLFAIASDGSTNFSDLITNVLFGPGQDPTKCSQAGQAGSGFDRFCNVDFIGGIIRGFVGAFISLLAFIIIAIAVIYTLIKLFIILVLTYINILLDIVFAPFWFLLGTFPGSEMGVGGWFKDMLSNLAVFPATIAMLMLANMFSHLLQSQTPGSSTFFVPPILGSSENAQALGGIIALGFFFMLPNVLQVMKAALKAPKIDLGPIFQPAGEAAGTIKSTAAGVVTYATPAIPDPHTKGGFMALGKKFLGS